MMMIGIKVYAGGAVLMQFYAIYSVYNLEHGNIFL